MAHGELTIHPLTPERWPAFVDLFGRFGASNGCWCMYWRIGSAYHQRPRELNEAALHRIVRRGPPPGLLALDGDLAVGWCQLTPRAELPWLDHGKVLSPVDDEPVWAISCFYVRRGHRARGVMTALIAGAVEAARRAGARVIEAYPIDTDAPGATRNVFTGTAAAFTRAGFREVARRRPDRPIMRLELGSETLAPRRAPRRVGR